MLHVACTCKVLGSMQHYVWCMAHGTWFMFMVLETYNIVLHNLPSRKWYGTYCNINNGQSIMHKQNNQLYKKLNIFRETPCECSREILSWPNICELFYWASCEWFQLSGKIAGEYKLSHGIAVFFVRQ